MPDVFPRRNLPDDAGPTASAVPWGRAVENRIVGSEITLEMLQQNVQGQNRNTASSLSVIAQQIQAIEETQTELLKRRTYAGEDTYGVTAPVGTTLPYPTPETAPITFTLTDRRLVRLQGSAYIGVVIVNNGTLAGVDPRALIRIRLGLTPEGGATDYTISSSVSTGVAYLAGGQSLSRRADRPFLEDYRVLDAGTYTLTYSAVFEILDGTSGSIILDTPKTSVQVLETA